MKAEGRSYQGVLYGGFMIPKDSTQDPLVIEFNCRFGDPETQVILPLLETDLFDIFMACSKGCLDDLTIKWKDKDYSCTVVCAAGGYPDSYKKGDIIYGIKNSKQAEDATIYHAGTTMKGNDVVTNGGRVLAVTGVGKSLIEAVDKSYKTISNITFKGMHFRKDIAHR